MSRKSVLGKEIPDKGKSKCPKAGRRISNEVRVHQDGWGHMRKNKARMEIVGQIIECSRPWKGFSFYSK